MQAVTAAHIEVRAVGKQWLTRDHPVSALESVSLDIAPQEFLTVLGPSGCGKSTLLSIIGGLTTPDSGEVRIAGRPVTGPDPRQMAMVFQDPGLFPWRTALENVEFGLELQGVPASTRRERARALLEPVGLRGFERRYPRELSGGMKQRVAASFEVSLPAPRDLDAAPATTLRRALWDAIRDESRRALDGGA
jgi:NitT/TauT family transport system ATP-binding protein